MRSERMGRRTGRHMGGRTCGTMAPEQCQPERQLCGTVEVHQRLLRESEAYARNRERIQDLTIQYMRGIRKTTRDVVRIPVVVHVVWSTAEQNIDDDQVRSQIEVLNRDFRRRNPDVAQVPPEWQQLAADARVEFYLATTDPSGNPTTGITRTRTSVESFTTDDAVKAKATGGADAWPADRYLNLWVCELSGGLLGYAQFPGGPEETDGVVVLHRAFGTTGTATEPFHLGRTATHEVGHWLNLYHIWGDDDGACTGSDRVEDTPNQAGANRGVPVYPHVSCDNEPSGDMFMNYMDYVDDSAMVMFTAGQVARIDACLDGPRVSFRRLPEPVQEPAPLGEEEFGYCGTMEVHQRLLRESPELAREQERIEEQTQRFVRSRRANARLDLVRIPVVVHVVWNTREQNISVDQIQSQIDALNRDFRGQNPDISRVPEPWRNLVGDAAIEFYLATEDPDGNPTSGITRTQTTLTSFTYDDRVKFRQMGGADPWPADRYLNLWVCRLRGRLLGYAQFPGMPVRTDGVVMTYTAFGTMGTAQAPFNLGRTTTHEVGHWLNLRHIWGDDDGACLGSDRVDDTPNQADKNFGRPLFPHISCGNAPNGDMFMNYMDYTDDVSRFMFTDGQVARMRAALEGPRRSLLENQPRVAPTADAVPARRRTCATQEIHERMLRQNPEYARNRQWIERLSEEYQRGARRSERGVVRIPVVVHVVWNRPEQNVSVEQIQSQIDVLNRDFRKRNPDVSQVPAQWQQLVADARVEFYLATTDPDGNPTSGITRTRTNVTVFDYLEDRVKASATGGADPWPSDRYLNMWVCQISDDILGYATPPGFPPDQDGVVILYTAFGTTGSAAPPFNLGRTATHEVGHWLNLDHIWGGNSATCGDSDNVADTPNQAGPNYQCPPHPHVSCNNGGDMFMNFMDYVDDRCMMMFTAGQVARMDACLEGPRASFLVPEGRDVVAAAARAAGPVVSWGPDRVDLFVVGADSALCHKWWDGTAWRPSATEFEDLGGVVLGAPQAITWGPDRLDVFVVGTDSAVYHKWWDGATWRPSATDWEHLGGVCVGGVKVVSTGPDRLDLFIVGTDSAVYHKAWNGGAWYPSPTHWENLGGICARPPEVVSAGPDRLDVFVTSTDSAVYHKFWDGAKWNPSVTDWEDMGGLYAGLGWAVAPGAGVEHVNAHLPS